MDPVTIVAQIIGGLFGYLYSWTQIFVSAVATGDQNTLVQLLISLLVVYLALLIVQRSVRMVWSALAVVIKLTIISVILSGGIYTYQNGVDGLIKVFYSYAQELLHPKHFAHILESQASRFTQRAAEWAQSL